VSDDDDDDDVDDDDDNNDDDDDDDDDDNWMLTLSLVHPGPYLYATDLNKTLKQIHANNPSDSDK
jgi:hypothetical protein